MRMSVNKLKFWLDSDELRLQTEKFTAIQSHGVTDLVFVLNIGLQIPNVFWLRSSLCEIKWNNEII